MPARRQWHVASRATLVHPGLSEMTLRCNSIRAACMRTFESPRAGTLPIMSEPRCEPVRCVVSFLLIIFCVCPSM